MLKEIVDFSKNLEANGIYNLILQESQKIDKPIFVIPVNEEMTDIEIDKSYFVFKSIEEKDGKLILHLDGKKKDVEIPISVKNENIKTIEDLYNEPDWIDVLRDIPNLTDKVFGSGKNIDRVGGISSYNILIFNLFESDSIEDKLKKTYETNKSNLKEYIKFPDIDMNNRVIALLEQIGRKGSRERIANNIKSFFEEFNKIKSIAIIAKFENLSFYKDVYKTHLSRKLFAKDDNKIKIKSENLICPLCSSHVEKNDFIALIDIFNSLNEKKDFLIHHQRRKPYNTAVCKDCAYTIYQFKTFFLDKLRINIFPLFITEEFKRKEIQLLKSDLTKVSFRNVIFEVTKETPNDVFDFYLVIYNRDLGLLNFDYISGFTLNYNGKSIFEIEQQINELFFEDKLQHNYFSKKVDTKNAYLDNLIYRYRTQVFDFVYRAKDSLNCNDISDMYFQTLQRRLRDCYNKDKEALAVANLNKLKFNFLELNKTLGGNFMQTVEKVKESGKVTDLESLSYYIGQMIYYLLNQSKKEKKTHAMVEPFINVANFGTLGIKLEETFNAYKHELSLNWEKLNTKFSEIWSFLYDNQNQVFSRDYKILFYAGYFDKNLFFESTKKENNEKGEKK